MEVRIVKALVLVGMFVVSFLIGFIPVKCLVRLGGRIETSGIYRRTISVLSCFAGGVFLSTCLMDLLPDTRDDLSETLKGSGKFSDYPVAEFIMTIGFIVMLATEQVVTIYQETQASANKEGKAVTDIAESNVDDKNAIQASKDELSYKTFESTIESGNSTMKVRDEGDKADSHNNVSMSVYITESSRTTFRSILLLIALSLHSLFEGLALGLQKETSEVLEILLGVSIHKGVLAFSLGMALTQGKMTYKGSLTSLFSFAIASPVGIVIGLLVIEYNSESSSNIVIGILQGLACGTFLYVTFFEILLHEFNDSDIRLVKVLCLLVGFVCMSGVFLINNGH